MGESYGTIWVCRDCMLHHANGECGSCHHEEGHDEEPWSAIEDGFHVFMGDETNDYSRSQCEGCGSWLHGERYAFMLWGPELER